jgi:hypothetical protein
MTLGAHLFGLPNVSQGQLELASGGPSCFLSVMCCGEAFHGLGFKVSVLILLAALFLPCMAAASQ